MLPFCHDYMPTMHQTIESPPDERDNHKTNAYIEIVKRRLMLTLALDMTIVATFALIVILIGHAVL